MRIVALNIGHQARRPKAVPEEFLDTLLGLRGDLVFLTEYVDTEPYRRSMMSRWQQVAVTAEAPAGAPRCNQVVALSDCPVEVLKGLDPDPTWDASSNFLSVAVSGAVVTGLRAPFYVKSPDWFRYWQVLGRSISGHIVIGDLNVDPVRNARRDRVVPPGWRVASPPGSDPSYKSLRTGSSSRVDHALVRPDVTVLGIEYRTEFFGRWGLDHCPLILDVDL